MVTPSPASIVIVPFPFSDLSSTKLHPAIVLADAHRGDWLLCQVTSNPYGDPDAIRLTEAACERGSLHRISFARPVKLFTASEDLMVKRVAILRDEAFATVLIGAIEVLQRNLPQQT